MVVRPIFPHAPDTVSKSKFCLTVNINDFLGENSHKKEGAVEEMKKEYIGTE